MLGALLHLAPLASSCRFCVPCLWITSPTETRQVLKEMLRETLSLPHEAMKEPSPRAAAAVKAAAVAAD